MSSSISSSTAPSTTTGTAASTPTTTAQQLVSTTQTGTSGSITSTGIGSGLNIGAIVSTLTTAYGSAQQTQLTNQANKLDAQVSAFGTFTSALDGLQSTLSALETPSQLAGYDATVADKSVATATASSSAVSGTYSLSVQNLATSQTLTSAPVANSSTIVGTGTLNISVGGASVSINVTASNNTLAGIADAINGATNNPGVSASIITSTDGARLVLSGDTTGAGNSIKVTETDGGGGLSSLLYDPANNLTGLTQTQAASDANFTLNGYPATSAGNIVGGALSGVTINLLGASAAGATTSLTISPDTTGAQTAITNFVTALNTALSSVQTLTAYNASTQTAGALQGNATLEAFQNQLQSILGTISSSNPGTAKSLTDLGITSDASTGQVDVDPTKLSTILTSSLSSVGTLLGGKNGIVTQIGSLVTQYTQAGGILSTINQGLQSGLSNIASRQATLNTQLATYAATLTAQYNAMDTAVAALKMTQTYLNAEFNPNQSSSSSSSTSSLSSGTTNT
jgi:flagellar hook-associated protein 2